MSSGQSLDNRFLHASPGRVFLTNVLPMTLIMVMNGLLSVVDAIFLGHFVGARAMAAVSLVFPAIMLTIAMSTLVSGGMSSQMARQLGGRRISEAEATFARAHGLALIIALGLIALFFLVGRPLINGMADGDMALAEMAYLFLFITILALPLQFVLGLHADAWRNEGRAGLIAIMSVCVTLANIALNYIFIAKMELGIAGSALGTVFAQTLGLLLLLGFRQFKQGTISLNALWHNSWVGGWGRIAGLGAPLSLSFIGIALSTAFVISALRFSEGSDYALNVAAYGIVMRIFGFTYLPLMAVALAMQSIVGNNVGAGLYKRSDTVLRIALTTVFVYCLIIEIIVLMVSNSIGLIFVDDLAVSEAVAQIIRPMTYAYLFTGPVLVFALYFQAIGQPARAGLLTLSKPFVLLPAFVTVLTAFWGVNAIWFAFTLADTVIALIAFAVLIAALKKRTSAGGLGLSPAAKLATERYSGSSKE
ncbi:MATE family efflux transporter [Brucella pseudogrignonensis]|jgi:putative MATE family efflux protein|uniref:MATE family efflux transporter n=1 Tax=Brucella pseudogrignonensis TaxID=419475 RepID=UPI000CFC9B2F|nr:MATE family efflux transporter [Brucella pseudogrignonensis]MQP41837.1 MATE family efflux transporter [Ochrobactrum sp. MYb237]PQZ42904.1 MATE family efflux transporter [Brucella pseudogrignonensis]PRA38056.1 MATE family efflux transporter [Brucella pseudogrignonensis]PRA63633.1 MATE family efflux transporter [Brucella pseudogrignonensis]